MGRDAAAPRYRGEPYLCLRTGDAPTGNHVDSDHFRIVARLRLVAKALVGSGGVREPEAVMRWSAGDLGTWARSSSRHQNLRQGSALEALLFDDVELQVLLETGEWAAAHTDRNRDRRKVEFIDEAETGE